MATAETQRLSVEYPQVAPAPPREHGTNEAPNRFLQGVLSDGAPFQEKKYAQNADWKHQPYVTSVDERDKVDTSNPVQFGIIGNDGKIRDMTDADMAELSEEPESDEDHGEDREGGVQFRQDPLDVAHNALLAEGTEAALNETWEVPDNVPDDVTSYQETICKAMREVWYKGYTKNIASRVEMANNKIKELNERAIAAKKNVKDLDKESKRNKQSFIVPNLLICATIEQLRTMLKKGKEDVNKIPEKELASFLLQVVTVARSLAEAGISYKLMIDRKVQDVLVECFRRGIVHMKEEQQTPVRKIFNADFARPSASQKRAVAEAPQILLELFRQAERNETIELYLNQVKKVNKKISAVNTAAGDTVEDHLIPIDRLQSIGMQAKNMSDMERTTFVRQVREDFAQNLLSLGYKKIALEVLDAPAAYRSTNGQNPLLLSGQIPVSSDAQARHHGSTAQQYSSSGRNGVDSTQTIVASPRATPQTSAEHTPSGASSRAAEAFAPEESQPGPTFHPMHRRSSRHTPFPGEKLFAATASRTPHNSANPVDRARYATSAWPDLPTGPKIARVFANGVTSYGQVVFVQSLGRGCRIAFNSGSKECPVYNMKAGSWLSKRERALLANEYDFKKLYGDAITRTKDELVEVTDIMELEGGGDGDRALITRFRVTWKSEPKVTYPTRSELSQIIGKLAVDGDGGHRQALRIRQSETRRRIQECQLNNYHPEKGPRCFIGEEEKKLFPWIFDRSRAIYEEEESDLKSHSSMDTDE